MYHRFRPYKKQQKRANHSQLSENALRNVIASVEIIKKDTVKEDIVPTNPAFAFDRFELSLALVENIKKKGYLTPTPIQDQAIPAILEGNDVIGIAATGTGKTAAFLLPLIDKVYQQKTQQVLVITPTRELALQIYDEFKSFTPQMGMFGTLCIGGTSMHRQKADLKRKPHFVIGTPGRLKDLIVSKHLFLENFATVVLDEADRMVDIGFISDITYFISLLPKKRQSLFFSATIDGKVEQILKDFVVNPVTCVAEKKSTTDQIVQEVVTLSPGYKKIDKLHDLLAQEGFDKVLVFGRTKWGIEKLSKELQKRGFRVASIHGNKNQNQRQRALSQFRANEIEILLATDVASRGLDIPNVTHVINYDMPATKEDYIHRIGRTGRADKKGVAITFVE